jgi:hypothetical protein
MTFGVANSVPRVSHTGATIKFSNYAIEAMGFKEPVASGTLDASFISVTVYEARGIHLANDVTEAVRSKAAGTEYRIAVSGSVNAACRALTGDDFEESEDVWRKTIQSQGPFALVAVGPTEYFSCGEGLMMRMPDGVLVTYDCFPQAREALKALEQRVLPQVVAALTCALNEPDQFFALRKLAKVTVGRCPDRTTIRDIRIDGMFNGYASYALPQAILAKKLQEVANGAYKLNPKAAGFFTLGVGERDQLKKFLYFFLALEIETHAVFGRINHQNKMQVTVVENSPARLATMHLLHKQVAALANLFDRFVWCATCTWTNLTDSDINLFKSLKDARDSIAHGRTSEPPAGYALSAQLLACKVLWRA